MYVVKWKEAEEFSGYIVDNWKQLMQHNRVDSMNYFRNFTDQMEKEDLEIVCDNGNDATRHCDLYLMHHDEPVYSIKLYKVTRDIVSHAVDELMDYAVDILGCILFPMDNTRILGTLQPLTSFTVDGRLYMLTEGDVREKEKGIRTALCIGDGQLVKFEANLKVQRVYMSMEFGLHPSSVDEVTNEEETK